MESMPTTSSRGPEEEITAGGQAAGVLVAISRAVHATRGRRVISLLVVLWVLNFFDLAYTIHAHQTGQFFELNPVARGMLDSPWILAGFKCLAVALGSVILIALRRHRLAELAAWLLCLAYVALAIRWLNFCTILHANQL